MAAKANILIRKGRVIDPASGRDDVADLLIEIGRLTRIGASSAPGADIIEADAIGCCQVWWMPVCTCRCQAVVALATSPAKPALPPVVPAALSPIATADSTAVVRLIREQAGQAGFARIMPIAAMTQGLQGEQLAEMATLAKAGCIAAGNAGRRIASALVLKRCLEYAATFDMPVMFRPQDSALSAGGCAHEGPVATRLGLPGIPAIAESVDLSRDLLLVEATGVRAHFQQISSRQSLRLLREAKQQGLPVTADVSIQHLLLDESALEGFNSHCHVIPPLRSAQDREALLEAVADGTIDAICSQHTPIGSSSKAAPFPATRPGMAGVDTLLSLVLELVDEGKLSLTRALDAVTAAPARCLGIQAGQLETGRPAPVVDAQSRKDYGEHWLSAGNNRRGAARY